jgi:hypothetical protein
MSSPELRGATTIVVDGYNLLLDLAEEALVSEVRERDVARARLADALEQWARLRACHVVLVWDGPRGRDAGRAGERMRVREVHVTSAEADDFIVEEVRRLRDEGQRPGVVTRDRGLLRRLPQATVRLGHEQVGADLRALAADPLKAPKFLGEHGPGELPASAPEEVDPSRLPRRRRAVDDDPEPDPAPARNVRQKPRSEVRGTRGRGVGQGPARSGDDQVSEQERRAREQARQKKEARRARYRRAQSRKK